MAMLSSERLYEVSHTLDKIHEAEVHVEKLMEGEPNTQPQSDRKVAMREIVSALSHLHEQLEQLYS